ncbi:hypothetical protein ACIOVE_26605, partial [Pseudomonas helmanticensis]
MSTGNLDFEQFRVFLEKACGILLGENKQYLVSSRLKESGGGGGQEMRGGGVGGRPGV